MKNKAVHFWRWSLIAICLVVCVVAFGYMNENYDPLARYPYVSEYNRQTILDNLSSDEIEYIISQQIRPGQFIPFIETEDFNIRNAAYYTTAFKTQPADRQEVVNFVNRYKDYFTLDSLETYLTWYSYEDLVNFIETQLVLYDDLKLVQDPSTPQLILSASESVYKYEPAGLIEAQGLYMQPVMEEMLASMQEDFANTMNDSSGLTPLAAYQSYEQVLDVYNRLESVFKENTSQIYLPGGENEAQLGWTIALDWEKDWIELLQAYPEALESYDYKALLKSLQEAAKADENASEEEKENAAKVQQMLDAMEWLENNAWKYGFVIRYPEGAESLTHHVWQPFVLRYVGIQAAKDMYESGAVMETFDF